MKCFVYRKDNNKRLFTVVDVVSVRFDGSHIFIDTNAFTYTFSRKVVKTRVYQN